MAFTHLLHQNSVMGVIIVVQTTDHLHVDVGATRLGLDADELATLEAPTALPAG